MAAIPEVQEVHNVAGEDCYLVKLRARDTDHLTRILRDHISPIRGISGTRTTIVLETVKETGTLCLDHLADAGGGMRLRDAGEWVLLGAIWGGAFLFTKVAVREGEFTPFTLVEVRLAVAAAVLAGPVFARREWGHIRRRWRTLLVLGAVNTAVPFTLFAWAMRPTPAADGAERSLSAGDASVLNATAALFAAAIGGVLFRERLSLRRGAGLAVGFVGVVLLVWEKLSFQGSGWGMAAALFAAFLYGVASHVINRRLQGVPPAAISAGSLLFAALLLLPLAALDLPARLPSGTAWLAAAALGVVCTAVAFLMYFRLLRAIGPTRGITVSYAIPAFGILWGWLWLQETVSASTLVGGAVIVVGTVLVQWPERKTVHPPPPCPVSPTPAAGPAVAAGR